MAFDAGAITASLTVDTSKFDRSLDDAEARVKAFEDGDHKVKITAVFDTSSLSRARQQFAALDNQISKDAMARLRSNPQGSVLGALNALFSPHPVTGAPSASQAAQQGLLGKIVQAPGGNGAPGQGGIVRDVLGGGGQSNASQRVSTVGLPQDGNVTTTDRVNTVGLPSDNSITTEDRVNAVGLPKSGATISTTDVVTERVIPARDPATGRFVGADATSTDTVKEELDKGAAEETESDAKASGGRAGKGWASSFASSIASIFSGLFSSGSAGDQAASDAGKKAADSAAKSAKAEAKKQSSSILASLFGGGGDSGGGEQSALDKGLIGGIGPGILGTSFKASSIAGLLGAGVGALPALTAGVLPLATGAAGLGIAGLGAKELIGTANQKGQPATEGPLFQQAQAAGQALQTMVQTAAKSLVGPLTSLFNQVPQLAKQVTPALSQVFAGSVALIQPAVNGIVSAVKAIGPGLADAFRATGPLLQPLIAGLGSLVSGLLPGLVSLLHAAAPAVSVVAGFFGSLGSNLGEMFRQFSTVIGPSSSILKALLGVIDGLLPVIGGLAQAMAGTLGPAFTAFAGTIQALEPFLVGIGKIFAQFAGAVLQDLSGGLQLVANVLKAVAPAFNTLATTLGSVFTTLESKGGFAQLGNILEGVATPLGNLIKSLVSGLAPAIPPILSLFSSLVNLVSTVGVQVLTALIPPLTNLATIALGAIMKVLPQVIPLVTKFVAAFTADAGTVITQVGTALLNLATVVLTKLLQAAQPLIPALLAVVSALTPLLNVLTPVLAGTISGIASALAAIVSAIPAPVITAVAVAIGSVVGVMKLWSLAATGVVAGIRAITGSSIVTWLVGTVGAVREFITGLEGATLAEKAMAAASVALDAVSPLAWIAAAVAGLGLLTAALITTNVQSTTIAGQFATQQQQLGYNISGYQKLAATMTTVGASLEQVGKSSGDAVRGGAAGLQNLGAQVQQQATGVSAAAVAMGQRLNALSGTFGVSSTTIEQWASAAGISAVKFSGAGENVNLLTSQIAGFVDKNATAVTATASLSTNIDIFGSKVLSATTQLDAFNAIWNTLVGNLLTKQMAVTQSAAQFDNLKQSIADNGIASDATAQSFQAYISQVGASASSLEKSGASVSAINSYLQTQIDNLTSLGPLNKQQQADVQALKSFQDALANSTHGLTDAQQAFISQVEGHVIADLQAMGTDTPQVNADIKNLADSIAQTGSASASTAGDRAQLIKDLEAAGAQSQDAKNLVDGLIKSLEAVPKNVTSTITVAVTATGAVQDLAPGTPAQIKKLVNMPGGLATGGLVSGPGGPTDDSIPAWLSNGEYVLSAGAVSRYGTGFLDKLNAQEYASGGMVSGYGASMSRGYAHAGSRGAQDGGAPGRGTTVDDLGDKLDALIRHARDQVDATRAVPAGVGARVGGAINGAAEAGSYRRRYPAGGT